VDLRPKDLDLDLQPMDLDLTISESEDLDLEEEEEDLDLPPWDLTTSLRQEYSASIACVLECGRRWT